MRRPPRADHRAPTHAFCLHVPFEQSLVRRAGEPIADEAGETQLRERYRAPDPLPGGIETVIRADATL
ncbi:hypothetical protein ACFCXS_17255 [Streptomyces sp. NPDC056373]|uniref:hypothetical protein n=1 Tax=Streptomyces sp. NPDC056373 TaxID=3345798 RepID=UPI0035DF8247